MKFNPDLYSQADIDSAISAIKREFSAKGTWKHVDHGY